MTSLTRRTALAAALATTTAFALPASVWAQDMPTLRLSSVVSDNDIRAEAFAEIAEAVSGTFDMQVFNGATLVAQGSEMTSIQRGNLEMGLIAPQTIAEQIPEWSIVTSAYLFSDAAHLQATFDSDVGDELKALAADAGIHVLAPVYFGTRQVNLAPEIDVQTPEDLNGITMRMPGGDAWQFLGQALALFPQLVTLALGMGKVALELPRPVAHFAAHPDEHTSKGGRGHEQDDVDEVEACLADGDDGIHEATPKPIRALTRRRDWREHTRNKGVRQ